MQRVGGDFLLVKQDVPRLLGSSQHGELQLAGFFEFTGAPFVFSFLLRVLNAEFGFGALILQFLFGELFDLRKLCLCSEGLTFSTRR